MELEPEAVLKFETPFTAILSGPTSSGKTTVLFKILRHARQMFKDIPEHIYYCYGADQSLFDSMKKEIKNITFIDHLPSKSEIDEIGMNGKHKVLILDDMLQTASQSPEVLELFTIHAHHKKSRFFFVVQNLLYQGKHFRTIGLNTHYFLLMKNPRDNRQLQIIGSQIFGGKTKYFLDAVEKATAKNYSYILIDISPASEPLYRLRTDIFPDQLPTIYLPEK